MSQPPNPPSGATPGQPGGWDPSGANVPGTHQGGPNPGGESSRTNPGWGVAPTQPLPAGQQYPPTQPLPAGGQYPGSSGPPGQPYGAGSYPAAGQYPANNQLGAPGYGQNPAGPGQQYGAPDPSVSNPYGPAPGGGPYPGGAGPYGQAPSGAQFGPPGQYGPPGGGAPPAGGAGGGKGRAPLTIGIIAAVVVLALLGWFLVQRTAGQATPSPTAVLPSVEPSVLITPSGASSPERSEVASPSDSASPEASDLDCGSQLTKTQCDWAEFLKAFVVPSTCTLDASDTHREAFTCAANTRGRLKGNATVSMRWADDNADLTKLMDQFFTRAGVGKSKIGSNWKSPPALTNWWYTDKPKEILGKLGSADAKDGSGRVSWTYRKQRFFVEATSDSDNARTMINWWART